MNAVNAFFFAVETADQFGARTFVVHFVAFFTATALAAVFVFAMVVAIRGTVAIVAGPARAAAVGHVVAVRVSWSCCSRARVPVTGLLEDPELRHQQQRHRRDGFRRRGSSGCSSVCAAPRGRTSSRSGCAPAAAPMVIASADARVDVQFTTARCSMR